MNIKRIGLIVVGVVVLVAIIFFVGYRLGAKSPTAGTGTNSGATGNKMPTAGELFKKTVSCDTTKQTIEIVGDSLSGVLESGAKATAEMNYYACNPAKTGDIVLYKWSASADPLIKIVRGVPGDKLALVASGNIWNITINGTVLKNSKGETYLVSSPERLNLYIHDYKGVIPADTYLLLGNTASGSEDSRAFGLVGRDDLVGKVLQ